jgi:hypothetical protein
MQLGSDHFANQRVGAAVGNNLLAITKLSNRAAPMNKNNLIKPFIGFRVTDQRGKRRKSGAGCQ